MEIGERIRKKRLELGLSQEELAKKVGYKSRSSINKIEGDGRGLPQTKIVAFANALETTPSYLMGWTDDEDFLPENLSFIAKKKFALFDGIAAGEPRYIPDGVELYVESTTKINADYALKVHGDSMIGARIHDGDYVFIRIQPEVENGEIAAVRIGDSATLKRVYFYREKSLLILKAENPEYEDMIYQDSELEDVQILGKAVAFQGDVK